MSRPSSMQKTKRTLSAQKYSEDLPNLPYEVRKPTCLKSNTYSKSGHWTERQRLKFCIFMDYHKQTFNKRQNRRLFKIFKCMAQFVKSRNANQCRSHHQKMQKQFETLQLFIQRIMKINGKEQYEKYYNLCAKELQTLDTQMGMNLQEDQQEDVNSLFKKTDKGQNGQVILEQKSKVSIAEIQNIKQQKQNQDLPTANTYGSYAMTELSGKPYQKKQSYSIARSLEAFNNCNQTIFYQQNQNNCANFMPFGNFINPNYNSEPYFPINTFEAFNGFIPQSVKHESQRQKLVNDCNYFWNKYIQSTLKLQLKIKQEQNIENHQYAVHQNKSHFLYDI